MLTRQRSSLTTLCSILCFTFGLLAFAQPIGAIQSAPPAFRDVPTNHWAYTSLEHLTDLGILTGYPDETFRGNRALSRYELAVVGARLITYVNALVGVTGDDPELTLQLREAQEELGGVTDFGERTARIEGALEEAASLEYTRSLEERVVALERELNAQMGEARFPAAMTSPGEVLLSVAEAANSTPADATLQTTFQATAQSTATERYPFFVGVSPGIVSISGGVYLGVQAGYDDFIGPLGGRARLVFNSAADELRVAADAVVGFGALTEGLRFYTGLGVGVSFRPGGDALLLEAPVGLEYAVSPRVGLYLQLVPDYAFAPLNDVDANLSAGVNFRF